MYIMYEQRRRSARNRRPALRRAAGQAIVEGAGILMLMSFIFVGLVFFLTDVGMTLNYQQKITFLASQGATFFATRNNGWNYQNTGGGGNIDVNEFVKRLATQMGLPPENITATTSTAGAEATVTVTGTNLPLVPGVSFLPGRINVEQRFKADSSLLPRPTGLLTITVSNGPNSGPTVVVPCYSGLAQGGNLSSRQAAPQAPLIPGPGMYDQFSFAVPSSTGAAMSFTPGTRGMSQ